MKNFGRAVRIALRHKFTLAGCFLCSLTVALLWGVNIGTVYPFVEVVFQGDSMHAWIDRKVENAEAAASQLQAEIAALAEEKAAAPPDQQWRSANKIAIVEGRLEAEEKAISSAKTLRPYIKTYLPDDPFQTLVFITVVLLIGTALKVIFLVFNMVLVTRLAQLTTFKLRKQFYRRTLRLDLTAFGESRTSELLSRFTSDLGAINGGISALFGKTMREPLKALVCVIGAAFISWRLLLFSLVVLPGALFLMSRLARSIKRASRRAMENMAVLYNLLSETFTGIQSVKAFTMERFERRRFHHATKNYYKKMMRISLYTALTKPNTELMGMGVICLAFLGGGYLVLNQQTHLFGIPMTDRPLDIGSLLVFYAFLVGVSDPARKMADVLYSLQSASAAADRIYPMLDRVPSLTSPANARSLPAAQSELVFDNVSFDYTPGEPVLRDIHFTIGAGEAIAIVGPNGCGKSTLANLIPRFYDPIAGSVRLGDVDLRDMHIPDLRRRIGIVTQRTFLFDDTVLGNIRYGTPGATDEEVIEAAKKAHAHRFITETLEHGYLTNVGEQGGRLSGGQRQRIALARAILRDPSILILDEATSQIDLESEQLIHQVLQRFVRGRTAVLITHRMATLSLANRILVMDAGRIVDLGTHDELLGRCPIYRRLDQIGIRESA